jgi:hypothetical protein
MYACIRETGGEFVAGYAGKRIGHLLFATHPHHAAVREWYCASTPCPVVLAAANLYSLLQYHEPSDKPQGANRPLAGRRGVGLCMMVDMGFGESTFHEGGCMKWREALTARLDVTLARS